MRYTIPLQLSFVFELDFGSKLCASCHRDSHSNKKMITCHNQEEEEADEGGGDFFESF